MRIRYLLLLATAVSMGSCREKPVPPQEAPATEPAMEKGISPASDADFVGLSEKNGKELAESRGLKHRVVSVDGQLRPTTRDYRTDRVNFELEGGKIVKVSRG